MAKHGLCIHSMQAKFMTSLRMPALHGRTKVSSVPLLVSRGAVGLASRVEVRAAAQAAVLHAGILVSLT